MGRSPLASWPGLPGSKQELALGQACDQSYIEVNSAIRQRLGIRGHKLDRRVPHKLRLNFAPKRTDIALIVRLLSGKCQRVGSHLATVLSFTAETHLFSVYLYKPIYLSYL